MLNKLKEGKKIIGVKQTIKAVRKKEVSFVYVAEDADARITDPLVASCKDNGIEIVYVESMKHLGKACEIEVGAAAAAVFVDD